MKKEKRKAKREKERKEGGRGKKEEEGKSTPPPVDWWFSESIREIVRCWTILKAGSIALVGLGIDKDIYIYTHFLSISARIARLIIVLTSVRL